MDTPTSPSAASRPLLIAIALLVAIACIPASTRAEPAPPAPSARDGQHDFDFLFGKWSVTVKRLKNPLHGSHEWYEMTGVSVCRPLWGGKANLEEVENDGPTGHMSALMVRLYSPSSHQWSLNWVNAKTPRFEVPTVGEFKDGRGEFYDQETYEGRSIFVRYVWSDITPKSARFEQAFSADGGKAWEANWVALLTRIE